MTNQDPKKRVVQVYLPSEVDLERWKAAAKSHGTYTGVKKRYGLSGFVLRVVEEYLAEKGDGEIQSRSALINQLEEAQKTIRQMQTEIDRKDKLLDKMEDEYKALEGKQFRQQEFRGERGFDKDIFRFLMANSATEDGISLQSILQHLGVQVSDTDRVLAIETQLEIFKDYDVIEPTPAGWRWKD